MSTQEDGPRPSFHIGLARNGLRIGWETFSYSGRSQNYSVRLIGMCVRESPYISGFDLLF